MEEKKIYCITNDNDPEVAIYVLLTEEQARAIDSFIEWADLTYDYSIKETDNITPLEW